MAEREDREQKTSESPRPGAQLLAHFELLEELGRGGMGVVYRAKDTRLGRQVAIKLLPAHFAGDPDRRSRFMREARAAAQLNHPNIATLYEVGEADWIPAPGEGSSEGAEPRKVIFLAMEYVHGQDLAPSLDGDGLSLKQTLDYGIQISDALAAAHAAGVIHRDLKPQNVRITPEGRVKILDFGLAKMVQEGTQIDEPMLTAHGAIVGTAPYMAPEQLQGASEVDSRCDLFSFGVVLYQMLTGRLPFRAQRLVDYVKALSSQTPEPPSKSNPEVSPQLEQLVSRLLEKEPARRYDSAIQVGSDLKAIARGQKIEPPPSRTRAGDSIFAEVLQPFRRPWVGWVVGLVFLGALLAVWWGTQSSEETHATALEVVKAVHLPPFENLTGKEENEPVCRGLGLALGTAFHEIPIVVIQGSKDADNLGVQMRLEGACQRMSEDSASVLLRLLDRQTGVMVWTREIETDMDQLVAEMAWQAAEPLGVALQQREHLNRDPGRSVTSLTYYFRGLDREHRFDSESALKEAVEDFRRALNLEPDFALAHVGLSEALRELVRKFNHEELAEESKQHAQRAISLEPDLAAARQVLARLYRDEGQFDQAVAELKQVLAAQPNNPGLHVQIAEVRIRQGQVESAIAELDRALRNMNITPGALWRYWNQLGAYLVELADYDAAAEAFSIADDLAPDVVTVPIENMIAVELYRDRPHEALGLYERLPSDKRTFGMTLNLGRAYFSLGDYELAAQVYTEAVRLRPEEPMGYASRGDAKINLGRSSEAREDYQLASEIIGKQISQDPSDLSLRSRQAMYLAKAGECGDALAKADQLMLLTPEIPEYLLRFTQIHALCGSEAEARDFFTRSLKAGVPRGRACEEPELAFLCDQGS